MFSWITQDTKEAIIIGSSADKRATAYMHDNNGNCWFENAYNGYGEFGGKDFFQLVAEMNNAKGLTGNVDTDRDLGIDIYYSDKPFLCPNLTRNRDWVWRNEIPIDDPNQGWDL